MPLKFSGLKFQWEFTLSCNHKQVSQAFVVQHLLQGSSSAACIDVTFIFDWGCRECPSWLILQLVFLVLLFFPCRTLWKGPWVSIQHGTCSKGAKWQRLCLAFSGPELELTQCHLCHVVVVAKPGWCHCVGHEDHGAVVKVGSHTLVLAVFSNLQAPSVYTFLLDPDLILHMFIFLSWLSMKIAAYM